MIVHNDGADLRGQIAISCRILAHRGLFDGILGHVSARVAPQELVIRCRGTDEHGLAFSEASDVLRLDFNGKAVDLPAGFRAPNELPLHAELLRARPDVGVVVHAHPRSAVLCSLADLPIRPVFGAYNIPAMRLALEKIPVYPRSALIDTRDLALEMVAAMGDARICLLRGHGITVAAPTVQQATVLAVTFDVLLSITVDLGRLGADPAEVTPSDLEHLPDLGSSFNDALVWRALVADLGSGSPTSEIA